MRAWRVSRRVFALCCVGSFCLLWGAASASAHSHYTFTGSFGAAGSGAGQLSLAAHSGVAVSSETHDVYVADTGNNRVDEFEADGAFVRAWGWGVATGVAELQECTISCQKGLSGSAPGEFEVPTYIAVDNSPGGQGDVYVADNGDGLVSKFDREGRLIESWGVKGQLDGSSVPGGPFYEKSFGTGELGPLGGIAVDESGNLWVSAHGTHKTPNQHMYEFGQGASFIQGWTAPIGGDARGIAVDGQDNLYFNIGDEVRRTNSAGAGGGIAAQGGVGGRVTSNRSGELGVTGVAADPTTNDIYVEVRGSVERFASSCKTVGPLSEGCVPLESFGALQTVGGAGLTVDPSTGIVYVLKPGSGSVETFSPEVPQPPVVESESVSSVTSESATFSASVDPVGPESFYHVEYGPTAAYGAIAPVPDGVVGSGFEALEVGVHVRDLAAYTTYHFRVVSHNAKGTTYGEDRTFTTQPAGGGFALPDGRVWELVTPAEKRGALFFAPNYNFQNSSNDSPLVAKASVNGDAMVDLASAPTEAQPAGYAAEVSVLSTRGPDGWSSQVIAPPHKLAAGPPISEGGEYEFFSEDLSQGVVSPFGPFTALSPQASEPTPYLRTDYLDANVGEHCESSCYEPLVTAANTQSGVKFGGEAEPGAACKNEVCGPAFVDATPDASFVALATEAQLTSTPNERAEGRGRFYYEWHEGQLQPLYLLPEGEGGQGVYAGRLSSAAHQLSDDGSVFFAYKEHLYLHDFVKGVSVRLDVAQGVSEPPVGGASFLYASSDGSRVLFSDSQQLTNAGAGGGVYECRVVEGAGGPACELQLTGLPGGTLIGGSEDASYLYFEDAAGHLVVDHYSGGEWTATSGPHVGTWPGSRTELAGFPTRPGEGVPVSRVSPDGRRLTFMSEEALTGYDNRDARSGRPDVEVFLYDASSNKLVCASCNPTGARPVGSEYSSLQLVSGSLTGNVTKVTGTLASKQWVAANLPPWTGAELNESRYQPRFLSDSGRLFFDSRDALVPQDVNGTQDVYEWEPPGVGGCTTTAAGFSESSGGCVSLISSGASAEESAFMDTSEGGGDAFFITLSKLVSQDFDNALDVYDARECTVQAPCLPPAAVSPPPCSTGDGCKAAPTPQPSIFAAPPSATFSGRGNVSPSGSPPASKSPRRRSPSRAQKLARALKACARKQGARRAACVRSARRRYGRVSRSRRSGSSRVSVATRVNRGMGG